MLQKILQWILDKFSFIVDWSASKGHLLFILYFTVFGSYLQTKGQLDINFLGLIATIQAFLLGHQVKDAVNEFFVNKKPDDK